MSQNISGFGCIVNIVASRTIGAGLVITQFADDTDPIEIESLQIANKAMGLNADLVVWSTPNPVNVTLAVIPQSEADINLTILLQANRVGRGKTGARDVITMNVSYPDGRFIEFLNGAITDGTPGSSVASSARLKSKTYAFTFESQIGG